MSALFYNVGDQCSSRNNLDTNERDCQQLVDNNNKAAKRPFTLECQISGKRQSFYKCHKEWCKCLGVFLNQSKNWWFHFICIWKFNHYGHFRITHRGKGRPLLTIDVKLCNYSRKYELFTIKINGHESGLGNIKNGLYKIILCLIDIKVIFGLDCRAHFVFH